MNDKLKSYKKYKNPDKRCSYPFTNDVLGYCYGFAGWLDDTKKVITMQQLCNGCEYWRTK